MGICPKKLRRIVIREYLWFRNNNRPMMCATKQWGYFTNEKEFVITKCIMVRSLLEESICLRPYEDLKIVKE